jgi:hypothetical protein
LESVGLLSIFKIFIKKVTDMKKFNPVMRTALALAIATTFSTTVNASAKELFTVPPSPVYQVIQKQSLKTALAQVAQRSGIVFKINTDLGKDVVTMTLAANDWSSAVKALLVGYNYVVVTNEGVIKTVIVTGHTETGVESTPVIASVEPVIAGSTIVIEQTMKDLPVQYNRYPAGAVLPVSFPVKELMKLGNGEVTKLDTPLGQFNVAHDNTIPGTDGSNIWVGHLSNEGNGYRMMLSQGPAGLMGDITTPEGTFSIESVKGSTYMIDTSKLDHLSLEGDTIEPTVGLNNFGAEAATATDITALKAALDASQASLNSANAAVTAAQTAADSAISKQAPLLAASTTARANATALLSKTTPALMAWAADRTYAKLMVYMNACSAATKANNDANAASALLVTATTAMNTANTALATAKSKASTALSSYNLALSAYNTASSGLVNAPPPIVTPTAQNANTVVDIMVEYTANAIAGKTGLSLGYTAEFAKQRIALLVAASNQSYIDSGIKLAIRLVYAEPVVYTDTNSLYTALPALMTGTGVFANVEANRTQYGADLVYLFRPLQANTQQVCGLAYLGFAGGSPTISKFLGYGVISDGRSQDSSLAYCGINTFTHEIGHSMGLVHDRENSTTAGAYPYSYAWGVAGKFGTIMSYKLPVVMYFSSPTLTTQCASGPCGYAETDTLRSSDQVKSLNLTIAKVAAVNPTMVATPVIK